MAQQGLQALDVLFAQHLMHALEDSRSTLAFRSDGDVVDGALEVADTALVEQRRQPVGDFAGAFGEGIQWRGLVAPRGALSISLSNSEAGLEPSSSIATKAGPVMSWLLSRAVVPRVSGMSASMETRTRMLRGSSGSSSMASTAFAGADAAVAHLRLGVEAIDAALRDEDDIARAARAHWPGQGRGGGAQAQHDDEEAGSQGVGAVFHVSGPVKYRGGEASAAGCRGRPRTGWR